MHRTLSSVVEQWSVVPLVAGSIPAGEISFGCVWSECCKTSMISGIIHIFQFGPEIIFDLHILGGVEVNGCL